MIVQDAFGLESGIVALIEQAMPQIRKADIDDSPDMIVRPSVCVFVPQGTRRSLPNQNTLKFDCVASVLVMVQNLQASKDQRREVHAIVSLICMALDGKTVEGFTTLKVADWKDTTDMKNRDDRMTVVKISVQSGYELKLNQSEFEEYLKSIEAAFVLQPAGTPVIGSTVNLEESP